MTKTIVANWKMNGATDFIEEFMPSLTTALSSTPHQVIICPPFPFLLPVRQALQKTSALLGAQNCYTESKGAFTGEVSAPMLADVGCKAVIVGHSERRLLFAENDALINAKVSAIHAAGLRAIVCVGENMRVRESGKAVETVIQQLRASLPTSATPENTLIAYEPIWAIGTGVTPILEEIVEMHRALHHSFKNGTPLLYGGSVTDQNSERILSLPNVDGILVGGASITAHVFQKIIA